ncbi:glycosyltransferase family 2 protein [Flavobacteriaceae sp. LMIT009]
MVSIVTPAYNSAKFIEDAIESVINQTYQEWEMIIVNDGSLDKTQSIVTKYLENDNRIKLLNHIKSQGAGVARNKAIAEAKGDYIAFLDADDKWKPEKLEKQLRLLKETCAVVCFSSYELMNEKGQSLNTIVEALDRVSYKKQLKCNYIGNLTGIYDVRKLGKVYMPEIPKRQDWVLWLKAIEKGGDAIGIKESLASYRVRKDSISSNKWKLIKHNFNVYRKVLKFGWVKSIRFILIFLYEYFFVKSKQIKKINPSQ